MRVVGVVSDTHLPRFGRALPEALLQGLRDADVDLILHAGDITTAFVIDQLAAVAPVIAVAGNNDPAELRDRLGERRVLDIDGVTVGLTHGHLGTGRTTAERAVRLFEDDAVELVVFGHSHQPRWVPATSDAAGHVRPALLNPGSPTDRRREPACSFAVAEIGPDGIRARVVRFARA